MLTENQRCKRSPLFYVGDKYKLLPQLATLFPRKINRFYEPFVGGGSVFLNTTAQKYVLNDKDDNLVSIHKFLIEHANNSEKFFKEAENIIRKYNLSMSCRENMIPESLKSEFKKTYYARFNKGGYENLRNKVNLRDKKHPLLLYVLLIYGFNRMLRFNQKGEFNLPVGNVDFNKNVELSLKNYFTFVKDKSIDFSSEDFEKFLSGKRFLKNDFIYFDPPYLIASSEYNKTWNKSSECKLLEVVDSLDEKGVNFGISNVIRYNGGHNKIFSSWAKKYKSHDIISNYINYHNNKQKDIKEVLITNY